MTAWTETDNTFLRAHWQTLTCDELAHALNRSVSSIRNQRWRLGTVDRSHAWSVGEIDVLRAYYARPLDQPLHLEQLAAKLKRTRFSVSLKASELGLNRARHRFERSEDGLRRFSEQLREHLRVHGHPRGELGMKHTEEARQRMSKWHKEAWRQAKETGTKWASQEYLQAMGDRMSLLQATDPRMRQGYSRCNSGKRPDLNNQYFRSRWEANYARYLNFLIKQGQITSWEYEADTFWFTEIKRGVRSYTPDFKVRSPEGDVEYHEVKGWDYERGRVARDRMARYYPNVRVVLVDKAAYMAISKWAGMIPGWESSHARG